RFAAVAYVPVAEPTDARYPLRLNTGRLRDQWHGMSRTGTIGQLFQHTGEPQLLMHSLDMLRRGLADGDLARVSTRRGAIIAPVASVVSIGRERAGVLFRAAFAAPPDAAWLAAVDAAFGLAGETVARYDDPRRGVGRAIRVAAGRIEAVRLAGDTIAEGWLRA